MTDIWTADSPTVTADSPIYTADGGILQPQTGLYMPNLVGLNYYEAVWVLQQSGIYTPVPTYAFLPAQITVAWAKSNQYIGGTVIATTPGYNVPSAAGMAVTLTVADYPFSGVIA